MVGQCGAGRTLASDEDPGCDVCRDRALLGQPCFGIGGSNGTYCRVLVGLKSGWGSASLLKERAGVPYRSMVLRTLIADLVVYTVVGLSENPDGKEHLYLFVAIGGHIYN